MIVLSSTDGNRHINEQLRKWIQQIQNASSEKKE
jgi:hypothetical protein